MKVVVFFGKGYEEVEALAVVDVLRRGGVEVLMAGVGEKVVSSARNIRIEMDALASEIDYAAVDMIVLPGGLGGVAVLKEDAVVTACIEDFHAKRKWIGAICAAPTILGEMGILKNHEATCYPGMEEALEGTVLSEEKVVVSDHLITAKGAGASLAFGFALLEQLTDKNHVTQLKKAMVVAE